MPGLIHASLTGEQRRRYDQLEVLFAECRARRTRLRSNAETPATADLAAIARIVIVVVAGLRERRALRRVMRYVESIAMGRGYDCVDWTTFPPNDRRRQLA
jgi:hypothetical protein